MARIYISPSVQDKNTGAGNYGTEEQRMNQIADVVVSILKANGHEVVRNKPDMTLKQICDASNAAKCDAHYAFHSDAFNKLARGCTVFCYDTGGMSEKMANVLYKHVSPLTPASDRGVKVNPGLYELNQTDAPAVLIEISFHDNDQDAAWIVNNIKQIGNACAAGILEVFPPVKVVKPTEPAKEPTPAKLFTVQVGAYGVKANADAMVAKLKKLGIDSLIVEK